MASKTFLNAMVPVINDFKTMVKFNFKNVHLNSNTTKQPNNNIYRGSTIFKQSTVLVSGDYKNV